MNGIYRQQWPIRASECDPSGRWRASGVLRALQQASDDHATALGLGFDAMHADNTTWVLARLALTMQEYPLCGQTVTLETWPGATRRWLCPRSYRVLAPDGRLLGEGSTLWVVMDLNTRRMVEPQGVSEKLPDASGLPAPTKLPGAVKHLETPPARSVRTARYSDLDVNGHVNYARYVDWLGDALGYELLSSHFIQDLTIVYSREVQPGQQVTLELAQEGNRFSLRGSREEALHFEIGGSLRESR